MLVVLAVIGVMAGATVLGIGAATRAPSTEAEARRLATTIQQAADSAMVTDSSVALSWDEGGYAVSGAARHDLPAGMRLAVSGAKTAILGVDGTGLPLTATIGTRADRWTIAYDGLRATTLRMPAT
jgi:general secretion pathway protein H